MTRFPLCLILACAVSVCSGQSHAGDWPQWLGPTRNGVSAEAVVPWREAPPVAWRHKVGNGFSVPVIAKGVVYVHALGKEKNTETVTAFDLRTGETKWSKSYQRSPYQSQLGSGPRATPTVANGKLFVMGITGELVAFQADTGDELWHINPYKDNSVPTPGFGVCSSPLVIDDRIVLPIGGAGMAIAAYDVATGKLAWQALDEPASAASPISWTRGEGDAQSRDLVVQTTLRIAGLNPADGTVRWEHPLVFEPSGVSPTPLIAQRHLICTTQDTGTMAIDAPAGAANETKVAWWKDKLSSYFSTGSVAADGRVFLITNAVMPLPRADVRCLDPVSGEELWKKEGLGYFHAGLIVTANGKLLILDDSGNLILADCGRDGYQELCKAKVCGGTFSNPALADGHVIVRDGQEVVCLRMELPQ